MSPPTWVVWIEIILKTKNYKKQHRHHPHGWCGLKFNLSELEKQVILGHHPHGWCGLKSTLIEVKSIAKRSPPTWVVWIEIKNYFDNDADYKSPPTWVVWIEILIRNFNSKIVLSHHPHGWCGLKLCWKTSQKSAYRHHPHGWCGLK